MGGLHCLLVCLSISPIAKWLKLAWLMQCRRLIGLYSFFYACCHLISFIWFELGLNFDLFLAELFKRQYIWLGMLAFSILLLLALTSPNSIKKHLRSHWQILHNWIYPASILIWIHFYWSRKADITEPFIYLIILLFLLFLRVKKIKISSFI
ncbi:protein-methionine-sulfoxide reductase heme-binding subunit MsrQ [Catenovulum maritimum]|uniref:sulfite oxidase heme-binding subunit YedZ n=1 Tax=Catenovulum maritimum TaxID=1513271 RepID=UPI00316ADC51